MLDDIIEFGLGCSLLLIVAAFAIAVTVGVIDGAQSIRAYDARVACQARQMTPERKPLTARVTCVPVMPRPAGRDTLNVSLRQEAP